MSEKIIEEKVQISEENEETSEENEEINEGTKEEINEEKKLDKYEECILTKIIDDKTYYQCRLCDFISNLKGTLKKHLDKKNKCYNTDSTECKYCGKKFLDKTKLKRHLEKQNKCYTNPDLTIKIQMENNKKFKIEKLKSNEEKLKLNEEKLKIQILGYEKEIKRLNDHLLQKTEDYEEYKKSYKANEANIYYTLFESYINKIGNLDLMFFSEIFLRNNRYDMKVMKYDKYIINLFDKIRSETLLKLFEGIETYNKQKNFEELFKFYKGQLDYRYKTNDYKKIKYTPLECQIKYINDFIKKNYGNE